MRLTETHSFGQVEPVVWNVSPGPATNEKLQASQEPEDDTNTVEDGRVLETEIEVDLAMAAAGVVCTVGTVISISLRREDKEVLLIL